MKREIQGTWRQPDTGFVKYAFPVFSWRECYSCKQEHKLEAMRVVYDTQFTTRICGAVWHQRRYFCSHCARSHSQAYCQYMSQMTDDRDSLLKRV